MLKVLQEYTIILGMFSELLLSNTLKNDNAKVLQEIFFILNTFNIEIMRSLQF